MNISSLTHVAMHVTDMASSLRFYEECLGLQKIFELKKDNDEDWLISFNDYFVGGVNRTTIKNLLDKFPKLKMLSVPNYNCYKALESAVNGDEYYDETGYGTKSKLNLRHLS